jgi:hypothetical protein
MWTETRRCGVEGCPSLAEYEVLHYDVDLHHGGIRLERDETCPFLCFEHLVDNERRAVGERHAEVVVDYPYTNRQRLRGMSLYRPLTHHDAGEPAAAPTSGR